MDRQKCFVSFQEAKQVGILATITNEDDYKEIFSIFSQIQQMGKSVKLVAYIDEKEVPYYCLQQLTADYFCKKDLNWYGKLQMIQVFDFATCEFDLMIDFTHHTCLPIETILMLSRSCMITGGNSNNKEHYDLFIDMNDKVDNQQLLNNIITYTLKLSGKS